MASFAVIVTLCESSPKSQTNSVYKSMLRMPSCSLANKHKCQLMPSVIWHTCHVIVYIETNAQNCTFFLSTTDLHVSLSLVLLLSLLHVIQPRTLAAMSSGKVKIINRTTSATWREQNRRLDNLFQRDLWNSIDATTHVYSLPPHSCLSSMKRDTFWANELGADWGGQIT